MVNRDMTATKPATDNPKDTSSVDTSVYTFLATMQELEKDGQLTRWVEDHDILLYIFEGQVKALSNICRHFGGPVGYRKAKDGKFTCLWHNWQFDCDSGACDTNAATPLRQYNDLKIENGLVYINLLG